MSVVTAAPADKLEAVTWWFPIVGSVSYRGYFAPERAKEFAADLAADGYDVYVRPATLYSTLGWFDDPLPRNLLAWQEEDLIDVAVHEQVHVTVYVPSDVTYDESLASFIAHKATLAQLADRPELAQRARDAFADELTYARMVNALASWRPPTPSERAGDARRGARRSSRATRGGVSGAAGARSGFALPDAGAVERLAGGEPRLPGAPALLRARARGARRRPARVPRRTARNRPPRRMRGKS